ncbi:MAG: hypothetical protein KC589_10550 [Nanoarchaeota archaeon]|nr:hypothetical protein [Nanoarchaeota archaeon]
MVESQDLYYVSGLLKIPQSKYREEGIAVVRKLGGNPNQIIVRRALKNIVNAYLLSDSFKRLNPNSDESKTSGLVARFQEQVTRNRELIEKDDFIGLYYFNGSSQARITLGLFFTKTSEPNNWTQLNTDDNQVFSGKKLSNIIEESIWTDIS